MPAKTVKSSVLAKVAARAKKVHAETRNKPPEMNNFGQLPPGINNGIAQLTHCKFGEYESGDNKGQPYFMAMGRVVEPTQALEYQNGKPTQRMVRVEGRYTKIGPMPLCDTKTADFDTNWRRMTDEMKKLGADLSDVEADALESVATALLEAAPYFRFRTSQGKATPQYPEPRTFENWDGIVEDYVEVSSNGEHTQDDTAPAAEATEPEESQSGDSFTEFGDVASLLEKANEGDEASQQSLMDMAKQAGISDDDIQNAPDWQTLVDMISGAGDAGAVQEEEEAAEEEKDWIPEVGDVYYYKPIDPKTKKPGKVAKECEVKTINNKARTFDLVPLDNKKLTYPKVSWDAIESEE